MERESAETVAIQALAWLVGNEELLPVFLGSTGVAPDELKSRVNEPEFLGSVLEFLTQDDTWVTAFCESAGLDYTAPLAARYRLPGGAPPHWT